jgi:aspartyl/asparaginyl beta-hydroxylase (cupin superfamily)
LRGVDERQMEMKLRSRFDDGDLLSLGKSEIGGLTAIFMANLADQCSPPLEEPRLWLATVSRMSRDAAYYCDVAPTCFANGTVLIGDEAEKELLDRYLSSTSSAEGLRDNALAAVAASAPFLPEPLIWLGLISLAAGDAASASVFARHSRSSMQAFGSVWDHRLSQTQWSVLISLLELSRGLQHAEFQAMSSAVRSTLAAFRNPQQAYGELLEFMGLFGAERPTMSQSFTITPSPIRFPSRFQEYVDGFRTNYTAKTARMTRYPRLSENAFYDAQSFGLARALEDASTAIIEEFGALSRSHFHQESERIARDGEWDVMMLLERGKLNEQNCDLCPHTVRTIIHNGAMMGPSGLAYFSRLGPRTRIASHTGPTNLRLRCHLGIAIPDGDTGIKVAGESRKWREGECLVLNDALAHEAWNDSDAERIVLVVDLWHPDLTMEEVELLEGLQRYSQSNAENLMKYWKMNEVARDRSQKRDDL